MELVALKCPKCGGELEVHEGQKKTFCKYCGSQILLDDGNRIINVISVISLHSQMYVTQTQHVLSRERYQMVLSLLDTQMRLWSFFSQRRREITTSSR